MADTPDDADRRDGSGVDRFEHERAYDREDIAAVLREFATAFESGTAVRVTGGDRSVRVGVSTRVTATFEAEADTTAKPPVAELALDLEWDDAEGSSVRIADHDRDDGSVENRDGVDSGADADGTSDDDVTAQPVQTVVTVDDPDGEDAVQTGESARTSRFEVYEDGAGEWRWRLVHWNGNIVADSGEGYASRSNAERAVRAVMRSAPTATIVRRD